MKITLLTIAILLAGMAGKAQNKPLQIVKADTLSGTRIDTIKASFQEVGRFPKSEIRIKLGYVIFKTEFWKVKGPQSIISGYLYSDRKHRGKYTIIEGSVIPLK